MSQEREEKRPSEIIALFIEQVEELRASVKNLKDRVRILEEQVSLILEKKADHEF